MKSRERARPFGIALTAILACLLCFSATVLAHSTRSHRHHRSGTGHAGRHHEHLSYHRAWVARLGWHHRRLGPIALPSESKPVPDSTQGSIPASSPEPSAALDPAPQSTPGPVSRPTPSPEPPSAPEPPSSPESTPSEPPPTSEPPATPEPPSTPESTPEPPSTPEEPAPEPPAPESPGGPPAGYELLFEDEFDSGSLSNFVQGSDNDGSVTVDESTGIATITLPADVSEPREELSINDRSQQFVEGEEFVLELERWLAPNTAPGGPGDHFTLAQFKGHEGRFPMVSEEFGNYNNQGTGLYVQDKNRTTNPNYRVASYGLGEWHTDRMYVLVSKTGLGAYAISVDGRQVASVTGVNTLEPVDSYGFIKIGAYGQPQGRAVEMKLRNVRLYVPED